IGRRFRDGSLTPSVFLEELLERIGRLNPTLNAFYEIFTEEARVEARCATSELAERHDRGPLHGIPIGIKDLFDVAGHVTTAGAHKAFHPAPAARDSEVVRRLRGAGAVILGKTGLHEWALGVTSNNAHFGPTRNPHDPTRIPGGSSGGSGAALAAGLCPLALGTDTGGSIRIPSALCGTFGIKPTFGLVSMEGVAPLSRSLDTAGPMANSAEDAFLLLEAMSDFRPKDVRPPRILLPRNYFFDGVGPELVGMVRAAAARLGPVEEVDLPLAQKAWDTNPVILLSEALAVHEERLRDHPDRFGPGMADRFQGGFGYRGMDFARALAFRDEWRSFLQRMLAMPPSVLAIPGTPVPATPIGDREGAPIARIMTRCTSPFNLAGVPVLSVPVGTVGGLPVGMQLVAPAFGESLLWALSRGGA
ncbi:MAG TPA: amidase, partial [Planctomycetota bacterium]|nr:amidase [Planctomycetota bacterium]